MKRLTWLMLFSLLMSLFNYCHKKYIGKTQKTTIETEIQIQKTNKNKENLRNLLELKEKLNENFNK